MSALGARVTATEQHVRRDVDVDDPLWQVIDRLSQSTFTRVPVFRGERTRVVGVVNTKRLALRRLQGAVPGALVDLVQPSVTTSPTTTGRSWTLCTRSRHSTSARSRSGLSTFSSRWALTRK